MVNLKRAVSAAILALASSVAAAGPVIDFTGSNYSDGGSVWSLGYQFRADKDLTAVGLGAFDYGLDGFTRPQQVGLWNSAGTLLASTYIDNSSGLQGVWRFKSIDPVSLAAGQHYFVASQGGEGYVWAPTGFTVDPSVTYVSSAWYHTDSTSANLRFPAQASSDRGFFGGNVLLGEPADVPEPAGLALFGIAALGLAAARRAAKRA